MTNSSRADRLVEIVVQEREAGCPMADEALIPVALRRWDSFERRCKKPERATLEDRAHDLLKCFVSQYPKQNYDMACLEHLAQAFASILNKAGE